MSKITNLTFDDNKEQLKTEFKKNPLLKDYNFDGSTLNLFLNMLSRNTYHNQMYNNMTFSETHLDSAQLENNIVSKAKDLGYLPDSKKSAAAKIKITITPEDFPEFITISKGDQFQSNVDGTTYTFSAIETVIITPTDNIYSSEIDIVEGIPTIEKTEFKPETKLIPILNKDLDIGTINIILKENINSTNQRLYKKVDNIIEINKTSEIFFIQKSYTGNYEVEFGDDVLGKKPEIGNVIEISYLVSSGVKGNNINIFYPKSNLDGYSNYIIETIEASKGGKNEESKDSIKFHAPKYYGMQGRAVISEDYGRMIQEQYRNEFESVAAWGGEEMEPPQYGKTFVSIKPFNGYSISEHKKDIIKKFINQRNVNTIRVIVLDPTFLYIVPTIKIIYDSDLTNLTSYDVDLKTRTSVLNFEDAALTTFNKKYINSDLQKQIGYVDDSVVSTDISINLQKRFLPYINQIFSYSINFNHQLQHLHEGHEGTVTSSKFTLPNSNKKIKLQDDGYGNIYSYYLNGSEKVKVNNNQGTVDYVTGKIRLINFSPTSIDGDELKINSIPLYKDAAPVQNQIILISDTSILISSIKDRKLLTKSTVETIGNLTTQYEIPVGNDIII